MDTVDTVTVESEINEEAEDQPALSRRRNASLRFEIEEPSSPVCRSRLKLKLWDQHGLCPLNLFVLPALVIVMLAIGLGELLFAFTSFHVPLGLQATHVVLNSCMLLNMTICAYLNWTSRRCDLLLPTERLAKLNVLVSKLSMFLAVSVFGWIVCTLLYDLPTALTETSYYRAIAPSAVANFVVGTYLLCGGETMLRIRHGFRCFAQKELSPRDWQCISVLTHHLWANVIMANGFIVSDYFKPLADKRGMEALCTMAMCSMIFVCAFLVKRFNSQLLENQGNGEDPRVSFNPNGNDRN